MGEHRIEMLAGMAVGAVFGLVLGAVLLKITKTNGKMKCEYDERQEVLRGRGFKYGFFVMMFCNLIYALLWIGFGQLPIDTGTYMILTVVIGVAVYANYCIWNDCYFSLNENRSRLMIAFAVIGGSNLIIGLTNLFHGNAIESGKMNYHSINLFCGLLFMEIFFALCLRQFRKGEEMEE